MPEVQPEKEPELIEAPVQAEGADEAVGLSVESREPDQPEQQAESEETGPESAGRRKTGRANQDDGVEDEDEDEDSGDDGRRRRPWAQPRVEGTLEALLFASPDVLGFRQVRSILPDDKVSNESIRAAFKALEERYEARGSGIVLAEISGGWQIQTREEHFEYVGSLARTRIEEKVTPAALETLAIIAYKQPITRAEIDAIRGVGSGQIVRTLMDKKMVKVVGRVDLPGRPFQYGTTKHFLDHFGLKGLKDLPRGKDL